MTILDTHKLLFYLSLFLFVFIQSEMYLSAVVLIPHFGSLFLHLFRHFY